jgi:hypothetical protein
LARAAYPKRRSSNANSLCAPLENRGRLSLRLVAFAYLADTADARVDELQKKAPNRITALGLLTRAIGPGPTRSAIRRSRQFES